MIERIREEKWSSYTVQCSGDPDRHEYRHFPAEMVYSRQAISPWEGALYKCSLCGGVKHYYETMILGSKEWKWYTEPYIRQRTETSAKRNVYLTTSTESSSSSGSDAGAILFIICVAAFLIILTFYIIGNAIYYATWPYWFPVMKWGLLLSGIEKKFDTWVAIRIAIGSVIPVFFTSTFVFKLCDLIWDKNNERKKFIVICLPISILVAVWTMFGGSILIAWRILTLH